MTACGSSHARCCQAAITQSRIWLSFITATNGSNVYTVPDKVAAFLKTNDAWVQCARAVALQSHPGRQVRSQTANPVNAYWTHVGVTMAQFDGIVAGAARHAPAGPPARPP